MRIDPLLDGDNIAGQWSPFILLVALSLMMGLPVSLENESIRLDFLADIQRVGTVVMFILLPVYLLISMQQLARRTRVHLSALGSWVDQTLVQKLDKTIGQLTFSMVPAVMIGFLFGTYQNLGSVQSVLSGEADAIDTAITAGNCFLWSSVALVIAWRIPQ